MLVETGLVLEGGGMRCVFTAGLLDCFMENDLFFRNIYSVSGSAYACLNYVSGQKGRTREMYLQHTKMLSLSSLFRTGCLFDMDLLFNRMPNQILPFHYDAFFRSEQNLTMSVTNLLTGEPIYYNRYESNERLMEICKASNCFPVISPIQTLDGIPVTDGGMSDAIPIDRAIGDGCKKIVVIMTKEKGFRKPVKKNRAISFFYHKYSNFTKMVNYRPILYNSTLERIEGMSVSGDAYAIYPRIPAVGLAERNIEKLEAFYFDGYTLGVSLIPSLKQFLNQ